MNSLNSNDKISFIDIIKNDFPSGIVVYLVALPLCLGIALASTAPLMSGIIAGIVGGIVISLASKSPLSVSGPAAGLTTIVIGAITDLGSFETFLLAVFIAGIFQIVLGFLHGGIISNYFPSAVIKGMLAAIGIILILKQIPHIIGHDLDYIGDLNFFQWDHKNTFSELWDAVKKVTPGAALIGAISILIMIFWPKVVPVKIRVIPAALIAVIIGVVVNEIYKFYLPSLKIEEEHLVNIPLLLRSSSVEDFLTFPDFSKWNDLNVWLKAGALALVASVETLLSINAVDKLDPLKRKTPANRELKAQGLGNIVSSLLGGLPVTAVIVRGAANAGAGARSKYSSLIHGILIFLSVLLFPRVINFIPYACLAAILLVVGYKLTSFSLYKNMFYQGWEHFIPFIVTILAIVFSDLLVGIGIGMGVAALFILRRNLLNPFSFEKQDDDSGHKLKLVLSEEVSFLNKANILAILNKVPYNAHLTIDGSKSRYIDDDIMEMIDDYKKTTTEKNVQLELIGLGRAYEVFHHKKQENYIQKDYEQLFINNKKWVEEKTSADPMYFKKMAEGQFPKYLFIGCSDSRVVVNEITGTDPGEIFVHRNIANLVVHTDMNLMSVLHYSVEVLKVEHVIVCGHYGCGGVKAAIDNHDHGLIDNWLTNIKDVYRLYVDELDSIRDEEKKHRRLVELNVKEQVYHLMMTSVVQNAWEKNQSLQIHGWVYDLHEGKIKDLDIDVRSEMNHFNVYKYKKSFFNVIKK